MKHLIINIAVVLCVCGCINNNEKHSAWDNEMDMMDESNQAAISGKWVNEEHGIIDSISVLPIDEIHSNPRILFISYNCDSMMDKCSLNSFSFDIYENKGDSLVSEQCYVAMGCDKKNLTVHKIDEGEILLSVNHEKRKYVTISPSTKFFHHNCYGGNNVCDTTWVE